MRLRSFFCLLTIGFAASTGTLAQAQTSPFQPWITSLLPTRTTALVQSTDALDKATAALCERTSQEHLDTARAAWRDAMLAWRTFEPLATGTDAKAAIDSGIADGPRIEAAVRQYTENPALIGNGSADYGLPAIEYLFWGDARAKAQQGRLVFKQRCAYAQWLAADVAKASAALSEGIQQAAPATSASAYADNLLTLIDTIASKRLGNPALPSYSDGAIAYDGWRSDFGKAVLNASLTTIETLLFDPDGNASALQQQATPAWLATGPQAIKTALGQIHTLLAAQPDDLTGAFRRNPKALRQLREGVANLRTLVASMRQAIRDQSSHP